MMTKELSTKMLISRPLGKGSCALTCPYSENAPLLVYIRSKDQKN